MMVDSVKTFRESLLAQIELPDYTGRHLFTSKLRLLIFLSYWVLILLFFPFVWKVSPYSPLVFNIAFLVTAICYNNVLNGRFLLASFVLEVMADVISQTTIIYLLGGKTNNAFLIYALYCTAGGTFYGPQLSTVAALCSVLCYAVLLFLLHLDILPPIYYSADFSAISETIKPLFYFTLNIIFLSIVIYGSRIANYFTRLKEKALEERNQQLVALHKISSTIQTVSSLEPVVQQVLQGVMQGLGYDICLLTLFSHHIQLKKGASDNHLVFCLPKDHPTVDRISEALGMPFPQLQIPLEPPPKNAIYYAISHREIVFRNDLSELLSGLTVSVSQERAASIQEQMGWRKFIIIPLVTEIKVIGALVGISKVAYVEKGSVGILEHFATQVALAIESAYLFDEIRQKNIELEEANRVKSEFLALMSHELRTPMHAILGFSELLADGSMGEITSEQGTALRQIHGNARNLSELINNVLDLAKAEAGKMSLLLSEFDFRELTEQVAYMLSPLIREKKQIFSVDMAETTSFLISADEGKLRQILTNLLSNAIKFTSEGGRITVSASYRSPKTVPAVPNALPADRFLYVEVKDTGIGISDENQSELFQPFKQVDPSFTRRYPGTGLGLALCKELIELHGGKIGVTSVAGDGSQFFFYLPLVQAVTLVPAAV